MAKMEWVSHDYVASANAYRYAGEQLDEETGLYYLRARLLDPVTGFTQLDPHPGNNQEPVTLHKYLYANGSPTMYTDPSGRYAESLSSAMLTVGIASTLASYAVSQYQFGSGLLNNDSSVSDSDAGMLFLLTYASINSPFYNAVYNSDNSATRNGAYTAGQNRALADAAAIKSRYSDKRALIGESQGTRVVPAAMCYKAVTLVFEGDYNFTDQKLSKTQVLLSLAYNYAWLKTMMGLDFEILDIGPDARRSSRSLWYTFETIAVNGYPQHYPVPWPTVSCY